MACAVPLLGPCLLSFIPFILLLLDHITALSQVAKPTANNGCHVHHSNSSKNLPALKVWRNV